MNGRQFVKSKLGCSDSMAIPASAGLSSAQFRDARPLKGEFSAFQYYEGEKLFFVV